MKIYNYNRDTKEFVNQTDASPNPLTSGEWLIPANATTDAPPSVGVGKVAVWDNDSWIVKDDNRGTTVYDTTPATGYDEEIYASESLEKSRIIFIGILFPSNKHNANVVVV